MLQQALYQRDSEVSNVNNHNSLKLLSQISLKLNNYENDLNLDIDNASLRESIP